MKKATYTVYRLVFPDGKAYVGMTSLNPVRRWAGGHGYLCQSELSKAIKKCGWGNIERRIEFTSPIKEDAELKEMELIRRFRSDLQQYGYNIESGGTWGSQLNAVHEKLSEKRTGEGNPRYGKRCSTETRARMSTAADHRKRPVVCLETGEIFESLKMAARELRVDPSNVRHACRNKNWTAGGYHWDFAGLGVM